jgi:hypothetical protein
MPPPVEPVFGDTDVTEGGGSGGGGFLTERVEGIVEPPLHPSARLVRTIRAALREPRESRLDIQNSLTSWFGGVPWL